MSSLTFVTALAAVSYMPVPDALCIVFSCPVVTILLSALVLRDRWGRVSRVMSNTDHVVTDSALPRSPRVCCCWGAWCWSADRPSCSTTSLSTR